MTVGYVQVTYNETNIRLVRELRLLNVLHTRTEAMGNRSNKPTQSRYTSAI